MGYKPMVGIFTWGGKWYGFRKLKSTTKYYKSDNCRFDNLCGETEEIGIDEYGEAAEKYARVFRD